MPPTRITVFYANVPQSERLVAAVSGALDSEEQSRALAFRFSKHRQEFIVAHALLRHALWSATGIKHWRFRRQPLGKPEIVLSPGIPNVRFSLSHTGRLAACAVCADYEVGIDVEEVKPDFDVVEAAAAACFTPHDLAQLAPQTGRARVEAFFRLWTLKEAIDAEGNGSRALGRT